MKKINQTLITGLIMSLSIIGCGKKVKTQGTATPVSPTNTTVTSNNLGRGGTSVVNSTASVSTVTHASPTCFTATTKASLDNMRTFFFPYRLANTHPDSSVVSAQQTAALDALPHANGNLNICLEYDDSISTDIKAHMRVEYVFERTNTPGTLNVTWFDTKVFENTADVNLNLYYANNSAGTLEIFWFDGVGFISLKATQVAGDSYSNGEIRYANIPRFEDGDWRGAFATDEVQCRNGGGVAPLNNPYNCVKTRVFGLPFFDQIVEGFELVREYPMNSDPVSYYDSNKPLSTTQRNNILSMARNMLNPDSTLTSALNSKNVYHGSLATGISLDLAQARNLEIVQRP